MHFIKTTIICQEYTIKYIEDVNLCIGSDIVDTSESNSGWIGDHPAEIAASKIKKTSGNSEEQLLRSLRKDIFTIPTLNQERLIPFFNQLDEIMNSIIYRIVDSSELSRDRILDVMVKVAAGNTYNKNIYEKNESSLEKRPNTTYKLHETAFMNRSYNFIANSATCSKTKLSDYVLEPQFVRGVFEEILEEFVSLSKEYTKNHHTALQSRLAGDSENYTKYTLLNNLIENTFNFADNNCYSLIRDAEQALTKYITIRSIIIAPYLRSAFTMAKKYGKNVHQILDNFQNGSIGLIRAVSCYSTIRPTSFSSVAKGWIKQCMLLSIKEEANFVKLPIATWQAFTAMEKTRIRFGIEIDDYEGIAALNKVHPDKVRNIYESVKMSQVFSIHKTYDQNEKLTLEDVIPDEKDDDTLDIELRDYIMRASLTDIERKILSLVHGITDIIQNKNIDKLSVDKEKICQLSRKIGFIVIFQQ